MKGQSILITVITTAGILMASVVGGWFSASNRVAMMETKIEVISERENNHFLELTKSVERIEKKVDLLLEVKAKK